MTWVVLQLRSLRVHKQHACPAHDSANWVGWKYNISPNHTKKAQPFRFASYTMWVAGYDWSFNMLPWNINGSQPEVCPQPQSSASMH
jgi:hypothetical protein